MGEPKGKGRPRFAKTGSYVSVRTPDETILYENLIAVEYRMQCKNYCFPIGTPVKMLVNAYYSIPKATSRKKRMDMLSGKLLPTKKPDIDNVLKVIADSLNNKAYHDDAQIAEATICKHYSDKPRVCVTIETLEESCND